MYTFKKKKKSCCNQNIQLKKKPKPKSENLAYNKYILVIMYQVKSYTSYLLALM